ncbi:uncharacterized protein LOC115756487 [Rhodamnia argentea]|uniref:Uncharacterized protein LOC115756487 n=1 Tax=Rhodamnia argentea TaxID=178133 RepID=A0A8B8R0Y9_9MYRT|nr:uncharacterized protein LOC115756487 [Rhodamnia argentea]
MEALWNLEDRWKLSTREAFLLFGCTAVAVVGLGAVAAFLRKARKKQVQVINVSQEPNVSHPFHGEWPEPRCGRVAIKRVLMGSLRWSRGSKWGERNVGAWGKRPLPPPLLLALEGDVVGWQSHNSESPVWQRPILMGEKCELPRFSGLILYDERGRPLSGSSEDASTNQEKITSGGRTTLKDLL